MATDRLKKKIGKGRHASTIKRTKQSEVRKARNRSEISRMRTAIKAVRGSRSKEDLKKAIPLIMKTAQSGIIHRRKAERLVSRLTKSCNARSGA